MGVHSALGDIMISVRIWSVHLEVFGALEDIISLLEGVQQQ